MKGKLVRGRPAPMKLTAAGASGSRSPVPARSRAAACFISKLTMSGPPLDLDGRVNSHRGATGRRRPGAVLEPSGRAVEALDRNGLSSVSRVAPALGIFLPARHHFLPDYAPDFPGSPRYLRIETSGTCRRPLTYSGDIGSAPAGHKHRLID